MSNTGGTSRLAAVPEPDATVLPVCLPPEPPPRLRRDGRLSDCLAICTAANWRRLGPASHLEPREPPRAMRSFGCAAVCSTRPAVSVHGTVPCCWGRGGAWAGWRGRQRRTRENGTRGPPAVRDAPPTCAGPFRPVYVPGHHTSRPRRRRGATGGRRRGHGARGGTRGPKLSYTTRHMQITKILYQPVA